MSLGIGENAYIKFELGLELGCTLNERIEARKHLFQVIQDKDYRISLSDIAADFSLASNTKAAIISKIAGHLFSFKDSFPPDLCSVGSFGGFSELITLPFFIDQLEKLNVHPSSLDEAEKRFIIDVLKGALIPDENEENYFQELASKISSEPNTLFLMTSGNAGHVSYYLIWNRFLIYMDKGAGSGAFPGVQVYALPDRSCLTPEVLKCIHERLSRSKQDKETYSQWIESKLSLSRSFTHQSKRQKMGNCTWASMKLVFKTLLALKRLKTEEGLMNAFLVTQPHHTIAMRKLKRNFVKELKELSAGSSDFVIQTTCSHLLTLVPPKYNLVIRISRPMPPPISPKKQARKRRAIVKNKV